MLKKCLLSTVTAVVFLMTASVVNAYPQTNFGTGFNFDSAQHLENASSSLYNDALNGAAKSYKAGSSDIKYTDKEIPVSSIYGNHDEAANAGYKKTDKYTINDGVDYNPYTGDDSNVNDTKSIYTDTLGRMHFFGKFNRFRTND